MRGAHRRPVETIRDDTTVNWLCGDTPLNMVNDRLETTGIASGQR